jgi:hypothetical protein
LLDHDGFLPPIHKILIDRKESNSTEDRLSADLNEDNKVFRAYKNLDVEITDIMNKRNTLKIKGIH